MKTYDVTDEFIDPSKQKKKVRAKIISDDDIEELEPASKKHGSSSPLSPIQKKALCLLITSLVLLSIVISFLTYAKGFKNLQSVTEISPEQKIELKSILDASYPNRTQILQPSSYNPKLDVWAGAAILIDASNGTVLYEKNADEIIPPASIAKLFVMYIVFKDVAEGKFTLDDLVPVPEKSWAVNMPRDASLMFLGQGHIVTLRELLKGLAVASGNDAALAVANYVSGSTQAFVERMNEECAALGLSHTRFVEPSGYDEHNLTTARELGAFCCEYIKRFPQSVEEFHSAPSIKYPLEKNLPSWQKKLGDSTAIYQRNTNPLLGQMEGCDGIKTGFIYESRYNLALTAKRNGVRFISVTMMGTGVGSKQGNAGRVHDGTEMMEWAFENFSDFVPESKLPDGFAIPSIGAKNIDGKFVKLVPAWTRPITVPKISGKNAADNVKINVSMPKFIYGGVEAGKAYGEIQYVSDGEILETVPLVADRSDEKANLFGRLMGALVSWKL